MKSTNRAGGALIYLWAWALLFVVAAVAQAAPPKKWSIVDLGAFGPFGSRALALNDRGDVVGMSNADVPVPTAHAFLWQNGLMRDLGVPAPGTHESWAFGITDKGAIIGTDGTNQGYVWKDGTWSRLPFMGAPTGINKFEHIVGNYETGVFATVHGYLYRNGVFFDLPPFAGQSHSTATAINDHGLVVGSSTLPGDQTIFHAVAWENGVIRDLGTLGGASSRASAVNNRGVVVGSSHDWRNVPTAFVYEPGVGMRGLFTFGTSSAVGINDRGAIVGSVNQGAEGLNGGYLHEDGQVTLLDSLPAVRAAGFTRLIPFAINNRGWIVGGGIHADGSSTAFLLIPRS